MSSKPMPSDDDDVETIQTVYECPLNTHDEGPFAAAELEEHLIADHSHTERVTALLKFAEPSHEH